jgi:hypothetical protein
VNMRDLSRARLAETQTKAQASAGPRENSGGG